MVSMNITCSPLGQEKNLPSFHHLGPGFVSLPHYSKKFPKCELPIQHICYYLPCSSLEKLLLWPDALKEEILSSPFKDLSLSKKHTVTNHRLIRAYNMHKKIILKDSLNHYLICHTQNDNMCMKNFCMFLLFSGK